MKIKTFLFILLIFTIQGISKPPELTPKSVKIKVQEILKAHVCHKEFDPEIMKRTLQNFIEELDPTKTYFIEAEIAQWLHPSEEILDKALKGFKQGDFSLFKEIHQVFIAAIERRSAIENEIEKVDLPKGVKSDEFKDLEWALCYEDLENRILRIKSLQLEATEKLGDDSQATFIQRVKKRRMNREQEIIGTTVEDRFKVTLSYILKAATSALDSHTNYFTPNEANQFMIQVQQRLFGIGAQLRDDLDGLSVIRILENSPASQGNKLKINDKIIAVNHEPVVGMEITEAVELIRGEKGTPVLLTILRESSENEEEKRSEKLQVELIRNEIVLEESRLESNFEPYGDGVIAKLKLFSFYQDQKSSSAQDIRKALEKIQEDHKLKGVILDLRGNAGGLLTQAVSVSGLFIHKGIVVSIKDNTGKVQHLREIDGKPAWEGPLFVLVDKASASAAEIVAQTLQDYGRCLVLGDAHTYGKGSFQTFTLDAVRNAKVNPQGEYKVTRGRYYTVSGKSPQLTGVLSDIEIPGILSQLDIGEQFAKFPLENDQIAPHFEDDLSDISPFHRIQLGPMYKYDLQKRLQTYEPFFGLLKSNSRIRLESNKTYQSFLKEIEKKNYDSETIDIFGQTDLQLIEATNVMKDLLFLMNIDAA